jgi:hypothetical protein
MSRYCSDFVFLEVNSINQQRKKAKVFSYFHIVMFKNKQNNKNKQRKKSSLEGQGDNGKAFLIMYLAEKMQQLIIQKT